MGRLRPRTRYDLGTGIEPFVRPHGALATHTLTNLSSTAAELVEDYYNRIGGRDLVHGEAAKELEKLKAGPPRKRGRASTGTAASAPKGKKGKTEKHPASSTPPAAINAFKPPTGSWEDEIKLIDGVEETEDGTIMVYLTWRNGCKTEHPVDRAYKRCPQRVRLLRFWTAGGMSLTICADAEILRVSSVRCPNSN